MKWRDLVIKRRGLRGGSLRARQLNSPQRLIRLSYAIPSFASQRGGAFLGRISR